MATYWPRSPGIREARVTLACHSRRIQRANAEPLRRRVADCTVLRRYYDQEGVHVAAGRRRCLGALTDRRLRQANPLQPEFFTRLNVDIRRFKLVDAMPPISLERMACARRETCCLGSATHVEVQGAGLSGMPSGPVSLPRCPSKTLAPRESP